MMRSYRHWSRTETGNICEPTPVPAVEAIVVSGDIIQGVPLKTANSDEELRAQYQQAKELLIRLCDAFLDGDRTSLVLVPGNHDVDWNVARSAMSLVAKSDYPRDLGLRRLGATSDFRWDWKDCELYRIQDRDLYESRLNHYRAFLADIYDGIDLAYELSTDGYYQLYELFDGRVGVAAFNSCEGNDCFAFHGSIPEQALANAHMQLQESRAKYELLMGVWHHNTEGTPYDTDYMDVSAVHDLISKGFRLGLHGHHHRSAAAYRFVRLSEEHPMALVSAGSLCAGGSDLPTGVNRQYNVIEFNDHFSSARVHVREMAIATAFAPARRTEFGGNSFVDFELGGGSSGIGSKDPKEDRHEAALLKAEVLLNENQYQEVLDTLRPFDFDTSSYGRALQLKALLEGKMWQSFVDTISEPGTPGELVGLVRALGETKNWTRAEEVLDQNAEPLGVSEPIQRDLKQWINANRMQNG